MAASSGRVLGYGRGFQEVSHTYHLAHLMLSADSLACLKAIFIFFFLLSWMSFPLAYQPHQLMNCLSSLEFPELQGSPLTDF